MPRTRIWLSSTAMGSWSCPILRGAHGVEDGGGNVARQPRQVFVRLVLAPGFHSSGWCLCQRGLGHDAARDAQAVGGHLAVFGVLR